MGSSYLCWLTLLGLYLQCKFCEKVGTVTVLSGKGKPLTQELSDQGKAAPLMELDCRGYEPVEFMFGSGWKAESVSSFMHFNSSLLRDSGFKLYSRIFCL